MLKIPMYDILVQMKKKGLLGTFIEFVCNVSSVYKIGSRKVKN